MEDKLIKKLKQHSNLEEPMLKVKRREKELIFLLQKICKLKRKNNPLLKIKLRQNEFII